MTATAMEASPRSLLCGDAAQRDAEGRVVLIGGRCADCGATAFPQPPVCTHCIGENIVAETMPRTGTLYAFSVVHIAPKKWKTPMMIGYVDLPNGVRVFTHLDGKEFAIGDTVEPAIATVGQDESGAIDCFVFKRATA